MPALSPSHPLSPPPPGAGDLLAASARPGAGPPPELERLFAEHAQRVYRAAFRVTGNRADAEDVLQTVFLRLVRREDGVDLGPGAPSYLYRAALNASLDVVRGRLRAGLEPLDDRGSTAVDPAAGPERQRAGRELGAALRRALATLAPRLAEVFVLRYLEGLDNREIGRLLGTSQGVVAVQLHRARRRLRRELEAHLGDLS